MNQKAAKNGLHSSGKLATCPTVRIPVSTYRLQLNHQFTFRQATELIPYLAELGISDCYCSPYLQARPGSMHGYDIVNHNALNPEIGSTADYAAFVHALHAHGMGQILDFVPNHMGVDPRMNLWWRDVLENGQASPFARYFDIDWDPVKQELKGKLLLPILDDQYGVVLERGDLRLALDGGSLVLGYYAQTLPIDPREWPRVLRLRLDELEKALAPHDAELQEFLSVLTQLDHLPAHTESAPERIAERQREKKVAAERLARLIEASPAIARNVADSIQAVNGEAGKSATFDRLHELLEALPYRLAYWRTAFHEINYRRFFDINDLAGLRMEDAAVFGATHELLLRLIGAGQINGLRLDHIDGLFDPAEYVKRLQAAAAEVLRASEGRKTSEASASAIYVVAEKILSGGESLPPSWPLCGASGYDFLNDVTRLFIDYTNAKEMRQIYERFTGLDEPFSDVAYECKKLITWTALASELNLLAFALNRISEGSRRARDFTLSSLREALREVIACFPVYRTYVNSQGATETDQHMVDLALLRARTRNPAMESTVFDFLRSVLLPDPRLPPEQRRDYLDFAMRFQQYTGPVQAKGLEDTAFYRYNVLVSLNEVGGEPQRFGGPPAQFHGANRRRLETWPHAMLATATHDTKRGEDVHARLNVLSEIPEEWRRRVARWSRLNASCRKVVHGQPAPDRNTEYLYYQTLAGAWPAGDEWQGEAVTRGERGARRSERPARSARHAAAGDGMVQVSAALQPPRTSLRASSSVAPKPELVQRLRDYMIKAVKEAKVHTSWINPNEEYDRAVAQFVDQTLTGPRAGRFLDEFLPFRQRIARVGAVNSLSQALLRITSPGVPDMYQGSELWDLSLVDPDNRRPVDFARRRAMLAELKRRIADKDLVSLTRELLADWHDGRIKMYVTHRALSFRRENVPLFAEGAYIPLDADGERREHLCAFARSWRQRRVIVVVPRLLYHLLGEQQDLSLNADVWRGGRLVLPPDDSTPTYRNVFTGAVLPVEREPAGIALEYIFGRFPVAMLESAGGTAAP